MCKNDLLYDMKCHSNIFNILAWDIGGLVNLPVTVLVLTGLLA